MTPRHSAAVAGWSGLHAPKPVASWYTEGLSDGIGDRLLMFDNGNSVSCVSRRRYVVGARGLEPMTSCV